MTLIIETKYDYNMYVLKTDVENNSKKGIPKTFQKIIILK